MTKIFLPELPIFKIVSECSTELGFNTFVIGGFVRDLILNRSSKDIDFVTDGNGIELSERISERLGSEAYLTVFKNFLTSNISFRGFCFEFVEARKESYRNKSRNPLVSKGTMEEDQIRRDFTINAMSISLNPKNYGKLLDPFQGIKDILNQTIDTPSHPDQTFEDDPLRMLRAARFASQLEFELSPRLLKSMEKKAERISIVSVERISDELNKILLSKKPSTGLKIIHVSKVLKQFLPELSAMDGVEIRDNIAHKNNFYHTLQVVDNLSQESDNLWLKWAALLHDIGKPVTKKFLTGVGWTFHAHEYVGSKMIPRIFKRLKLPGHHQMKFVKKMVAMHQYPMNLVEKDVSDSGIRRLVFKAGEDLDDLLMLCKSDITSKNSDKIVRIKKNYEWLEKRIIQLDKKEKIRNFKNPVSGHDVMALFELKSGVEIGKIKENVKEAILNGEISNDRNKALILAKEIGDKMGLKPKEN